MTKKIEIDETHIPILIEMYETKKAEAIKYWDDKIADLKKIIALSGPATLVIQGSNSINVYPGGKWIDKVRWVIRQKGKATAGEVFDEVAKYEPTYKDKRKQVIPTVSSTLKNNSEGDDAIFTREEVSGVFYYELKK